MQEALKEVDVTRAYSVERVVTLARDTNIVKSNATVRAVYKLNVDSKKTDQQIRGAAALPDETGETQTVLVFAKDGKAKEVRAVDTDFIGDDDMVAKIRGGWSDFDVVVAIPDMMVIVGKLGRVLGLKGLIPSPRTGIVTTDATKAVERVKASKVTYRVNKAGNTHVPIGKVSFDDEKLVENFNTTNNVLLKARPSAAKGQYIKNTSVTATFGPGIYVDQASF